MPYAAKSVPDIFRIGTSIFTERELGIFQAGGVDVTVLDGAEAEMASYKVHFGVWKCRFDNLDVKERNPDCQTGFVK